jgi:hypothetical protein
MWLETENYFDVVLVDDFHRGNLAKFQDDLYLSVKAAT